MARPHNTYRGSRPHDKRPSRALMLKAARERRGLTRSEFDRERAAVRDWLLDPEKVMRGFTAERLHALAQEMAQGVL